MKQTIRVKDLSVFFTNINTEMALAGHSHFGLVTMEFSHNGTGFPAFGTTYSDIKEVLKAATKLPFRDATNEQVARDLFITFRDLDYTKFGWKYATNFKLKSLTLSVRGVPDRFDHADGFTDYVVEE